MATARETVIETVERSCNSAQCKGRSTPQRLIKRQEDGQPTRMVFECTVCRARDRAPAAR